MSVECLLNHDGRYRATLAKTDAEIASAQTFRARLFGLQSRRDTDALDDACDHILIHDAASDAFVCCFRILVVSATTLSRCYAARHYDLSALHDFRGPFLEMSRFCVDPERRDPDIFRLAWAAVTKTVDTKGVTLLFGCSSFKRTDPAPYYDAFAFLRSEALAPPRWAPRRKAAEVYSFAHEIDDTFDRRRARQQMPPLLRTYLGMGGWVSDHAVIDREMDTLHVFTGVETAAIPQARKRQLRALQREEQSAAWAKT